jgi:hypothetical protein
MSTRARIGYQDPISNLIHSIYLHQDGDPKWAGKTLLEHYNTLERIKELVALGSISQLEMYLSPSEAPGLLPRYEKQRPYPNDWRKHSFSFPASNVTIAYKRDRHDSGDIGIMVTHLWEDAMEHNYLFKDGMWMHKPQVGIWKSFVIGRQPKK